MCARLYVAFRTERLAEDAAWSRLTYEKYPPPGVPSPDASRLTLLQATYDDAHNARLAIRNLMVAIGCNPATGKPTTVAIRPLVDTGAGSTPTTILREPGRSGPECDALVAERDRLLADLDTALHEREKLAWLITEEALMLAVSADFAKTPNVRNYADIVQAVIVHRRAEIELQVQNVQTTQQQLLQANQELVMSGCDIESGPIAASPSPTSATTRVAPTGKTTTTKAPKTVTTKTVTTKAPSGVFRAGPATASLSFGDVTSVSDPSVKNPWSYVPPAQCPVGRIQVAADGSLSSPCSYATNEDRDGFQIQPGETTQVEFQNTWTRAVTGKLDFATGRVTFRLDETRTRSSVSANAVVTIHFTVEGTASYVRRIDTVSDLEGVGSYAYSCQRSGGVPVSGPNVSCPISGFSGKVPVKVSVW